MKHQPLRHRFPGAISLFLIFSVALIVSQPALSAPPINGEGVSSVKQGPSNPQLPSENGLVITPTLVETLPPDVPAESMLTSAEPLPVGAEGMTHQRLPGKRVLGQGSTLFAATALSDDWLTWLLTTQHGDGPWGDSADIEVRDTTEVIATYIWLDLSGTSLQAAGNWADQLFAGNLDYLARQIMMMTLAGEDIGDLDDQLVAAQNSDGGFGFRAGYGSEPLTTLVVLQGLEVAGYRIGTPEGDAAIGGSLFYLMDVQDAAGGWGYTGEDESRVVMTALVLETLRPYRAGSVTRGDQTYVVATEIDEGLAWLKSQQNPDGGWGADGSTVYQSALTSMAILNLGDEPTDLSGAQGYLVGEQDANGSWEDDPFTTAVAKRALSAFPWGVKNGSDVASGISGVWQAGYVVAANLYPSTNDYPLQVEKASFWLYNFAGVASVTVRLRIYSVTPDLHATLLALTSEIYIESPGQPSFIIVDLSNANILVHAPNSFMIGVEYLDGSPGSTPSTFTDDSTNIATNRNFYSPNGGVNWYEHYNFWASPEQIGYNMIRATVRTNVPIPATIQSISGQAGTAQAQGTVDEPDSTMIKLYLPLILHSSGGKSSVEIQATNDLVLSWTEVLTDSKGRYVNVDHYNIYRSTDPYFVPTQFNLYGTSSDTSFTDPGALGDTNNNYVYVSTAVDAEGRESAPSTRFGEFDFAFVPGAQGGEKKYNLIALNLEVSGVTDADSLASYAGSGMYMVIKYDAPTQSIVWRLPGLAGTNFPVRVGEPYFLYLDDTAPNMLSLVGEVPSRGAVQFALTRAAPGDSCKYNFISIPLDRGDLADADALAADIGGVYMVIRYNAETQDLTWRLPGLAGENFPVRAGYPYIVCLDENAPAVWP